MQEKTCIFGLPMSIIAVVYQRAQAKMWAILEIVVKGLWKSHGHNVNRHGVIIYECNVWPQTPWAFRHSILPWGHNFLLSILDNQKGFMSALLIF